MTMQQFTQFNAFPIYRQRCLQLIQKSALCLGIGCILSACGAINGLSFDTNAIVFRHDGSVQCDTAFDKQISIINSRALLTNKGIDVIETGCGVLEEYKGPEICGAPSGNVNLFTIPSSNVMDVTDIGFSRQGTSAAITVVECPKESSLDSLFGN